ncbi:interferon-inducible double-stranded RNA-dependent protein kinase activator A homolog isoform X3 [Condylostylus longicornis]|uniref:interferon-inducible double-stranded RNA-dependent protein kinase activator A homolog isoform X3 n=1 Tax=Condylostylus longicornis TaxID=2530218 RepID=UPI00244E3037|nr:interferon-inducible double-stranded RNA-dependent protein kinase activator A homolog isoform X3 [Condylostylus longicornis]
MSNNNSQLNEDQKPPQQNVGGYAPRRRSGRPNKNYNQQNLQQQQPQTQPAATEDPLSIEDALKNVSKNNLRPLNQLHEIPSIAMKTPVSILQELLSRHGITPSYELVQIEGAIHEPTFRYRVSFNDKDIPFTAMGAGRSKKEAKHAAAKALIDKLTGTSVGSMSDNNPTLSATTNGDTTSIGNLQETSYEEKVQGNPIGWLQEMCMARRWPPPTYETEMEVGLPHERQFTIACTILKYREVGRGKSKKVAKRLAAHKMWTRLQENPLDHAQITSVLDEEGNEESTCLKNTEINYVQFLEEIAHEHEFEVTYVDIEEKTYSGRSQCLVQLSTLPVAVCHGSGLSSKEAQANAAHNALEYLKIMTKK